MAHASNPKTLEGEAIGLLGQLWWHIQEAKVSVASLAYTASEFVGWGWGR